MTDSHAHTHTHTHGGDAGNPGQRRRLLIALALTWGFALVEALAGWRGGSLALLADAGHMVTDGAALGLALLAAWFAAWQPSTRHSCGLGRAALINALTMLAVVVGIAVEAWSRFAAPRPIDGLLVSVVALIGLGVNLFVAWLLSHGQENLNVRVADLTDWPPILAALQHEAAEHGIGHPTFQPETIPWSPLLRQAQ